MHEKNELLFSSSCFLCEEAGLTCRRWGVMIYSPSWLEVDAILDEYYAPTPPTYTPPAEAALSQAACVCGDHSVGCKLYF